MQTLVQRRRRSAVALAAIVTGAIALLEPHGLQLAL